MFVTLAFVVGLAVVAGRWPVFRLRQPPGVDEQRFLAAVHSELRAGASLRWAIADAAAGESDGGLAKARRLALAGAPITELATSLRQLPENGRRIAAAIEVAALSGGRSADLFLRLADHAATASDVARQQRTLTTQARMSAMVVGGLPLVWLVFGGVGRIHGLVEQGAGLVAVAGLALEALGSLLVWRLAVS